MILRLILLLLASMLSSIIWAHPGHGTHQGFSLIHYLVDHGLAIFFIVIIFVAIRLAIKK